MTNRTAAVPPKPGAAARLDAIRAELEQIRGAAPTVARGEAAEAAQGQALQARQRAAALSQQAHELVAKRQAEIESEREALARAQRELTQLLEPILETVRGLNRVVDAVGLYLGLREQFVTIRADGEPAPIGTPFTIFQQVLAMDEESKLAVDHGGITYQDLDEVDEWLQDDPAHLEQLLPAQLGVVALIPRRADLSTGDPFTDAELKRKNTQVWFLVRNGERLHRFTAEDVTIGEHLVPDPDRWRRFFLGRDGTQLQPGTREWERAAEQATAATRHAMRIGLILQGTVDRTNLLSPAIPQGSLDLLGPTGLDDPRVVLVRDGAGALEDGRPGWAEFQRSRMARVQVGSRIVGDFQSWAFHRDRDERLERKHPKYASTPASFLAHQLSRSDTVHGEPAFRFAYDRSDEVFVPSEGGFRPPQTRASYLVLRSDRNVIPIDEVTVDEVTYYATSRRQAREYLDSLPVIRAALQVKRDEQQAQQPFLDEAARRIAHQASVPLEDAAVHAERALGRWRTATKYARPLVDLHEPRAGEALRFVVEQSVDTVESFDADIAAVRVIREWNPRTVAISRRTNGQLEAIAPEPLDNYGTLIPERNFATVTTYSAKQLRLTGTRHWQYLSKAAARTTRLLWAAPEWDDWRFLSNRAADPAALTGPEIDQAAAELRAHPPARADALCWRVGAHRTNTRVLFYAIDVVLGAKPTFLATAWSRRAGERLVASRLVDPAKALGWLRPGFRSTEHDEYPTVHVGNFSGIALDRLIVLHEDATVRAQIEQRRAADNERRRLERELDTWWSPVVQAVRRTLRDEARAAARAPFLATYSAEERLWPRGWQRTVTEAEERARREADKLLDGARPDAERDLTGLTLAQLLPDADLPPGIAGIVPVPATPAA